MQRFESFGLRGSGDRRSRTSVNAEAMLRTALDAVRDSSARVTVPRKSVPPKPVPKPGTPVETRPATTVLPGGSARLVGRDELAWALRTLRNMPSQELRAEIRRDPEMWARAVANLRRLRTQLTADRC